MILSYIGIYYSLVYFIIVKIKIKVRTLLCMKSRLLDEIFFYGPSSVI